MARSGGVQSSVYVEGEWWGGGGGCQLLCVGGVRVTGKHASSRAVDSYH